MSFRQKLFLILTISSTLFIFSNSLQTAESSSSESGIFVNFLNNILSFLNINASRDFLTFLIRKSAHVVEFMLQSVFLCGFFLNCRKKFREYLMHIMFSGIITACIDEALQLTSPGRSGQISDVFVDFSGTLIGILIIMLVLYFYKRKSGA